MTTLRFDTLKFARKLEAAGFSHQQAEGLAEALADALIERATAANATEQADVISQPFAFADATNFRAELGRFEASLISSIELFRRDLKIWFGSVMVVAVVVLLAAIRYLRAPH